MRCLPRPHHEGGRGEMEAAVDLSWRKSSYSGNGGGTCVEVASRLPGGIAVRDSKDPDGPVLALQPASWRALTDAIKAGRHNLF
jgi:hypothetical protein